MQRIPDTLLKLVRAKSRAASGDLASRDRLFAQLLWAAAPEPLASLLRSGQVEGLGALFGQDGGDGLPQEVASCVREEPLLAGWALQVWNEPERDASSWGVSRRGESRAEEASLSAATQIFTEEYMAQFLCSRIVAGLKVSRSGMCDPACGTGHLLVAAFREMRRREPGLAALGALHELFGCDIDPVAVRMCRAILLCEASRAGLQDIRPALELVMSQVLVADEPHGALDRSSECAVLRRRYGAVLANPPYLGRRKQGLEMRSYLSAQYPGAAIDLCAAFMERCLELLEDGGWLGLVTSDKWLRLKGYAPLRAALNSQLSLDAVCELGERAFDRRLGLHDGMRVVLVTARKEPAAVGHRLRFMALSQLKSVEEKTAGLAELGASGHDAGSSRALQAELLGGGDGALFLESAGLPAALLSSQLRVGQVARVVVGLQTNNDARFVRFHWEVDPDPRRWRVHAKGGGYCKWFGLNRTVLDWQGWLDSGEISSRSGLSAEQWFSSAGWVYSWFANGDLGLREKEAGWTFGRAAASGFFSDADAVVAFLNSALGSLCARRIGGKAQLPEGIVRRIPVPERLADVGAGLVRWAVRLKRALVSHDLTDISFSLAARPLLLEAEATEAVLLAVEGVLELQVLRSLGVEPTKAAALGVCPVGLCPMTPAAWSDEVWGLVPAEFAPLRAELQAELHSVAAEGAPHDTQGSQRIRSTLLAGPTRRGLRSGVLRCDGPLERLSAETGIHPLDAVRHLAVMRERDLEVRAALLRPMVEREVCVQVLHSVGHRWWHGADSVPREARERQPLDAVAGRVQDAVGQERIEVALGMPIKGWLVERFPGWLGRVFFGREPVLFASGRGGSFVHRLDAEPGTRLPTRARASSPKRPRGGRRASWPERSL